MRLFRGDLRAVAQARLEAENRDLRIALREIQGIARTAADLQTEKDLEEAPGRLSAAATSLGLIARTAGLALTSQELN